MDSLCSSGTMSSMFISECFLVQVGERGPRELAMQRSRANKNNESGSGQCEPGALSGKELQVGDRSSF